MHKVLGILIVLLIFMSACSNDEPAIVKVDTPPEEASEDPELVEEITEDEEVDEFIEFPLEDEVVRVNLHQVPILNAYLQAAEDWDTVIEKMKIQRIVNDEENNIYLLEFSCNSTSCSYLLLDETSENSGFLVADLAIFESSILSPDESKLLLKFNRESSVELPMSDIVVIDLDNWQELSLQHEEIDNNLLDFSWPILLADWVDNETVSMSIADIFQPAPEQIDDLGYEENQTSTIIFDVVNNN